MPMTSTEKKKSSIITQILNVSGIKGKAQRDRKRKTLMGWRMTGSENNLRALLASAKAAAGAQAPKKTPAKKTSTKKASTKKASTKKASTKKVSTSKRRSSRKLPASLKSRASKLSAALKSGKITAKTKSRKKIMSPADLSGTTRERYDAFIALYKGVSTGRKVGRKAASKTITEVYSEISGNKFPYFLSAGYNVGGGKGGPGIIRTVPKSGATPFRQLSASQQRKVVAWLNGPGKAMRSKGAKREASSSLVTS